MVLSERLSTTIFKYSGDHPRYQRQSSAPWQGGKGIRSRRVHVQIYPTDNPPVDSAVEPTYPEPMTEDKDDRWSWHGSDPTDVPAARSNIKCRSAGYRRGGEGDHARQITLQLVRARDGSFNVNTVTNKSPLNQRCTSAPVSKPTGSVTRGSAVRRNHNNNNNPGNKLGELPFALVGKKIGSATGNSTKDNANHEAQANNQILFPQQRDPTEGELASKISSLHLQYSNGMAQPIILCEDVDQEDGSDGKESNSGLEDIDLQEEAPGELHCLSVPRLDLGEEKRRPPLRETHGVPWIAC